MNSNMVSQCTYRSTDMTKGRTGLYPIHPWQSSLLLKISVMEISQTPQTAYASQQLLWSFVHHQN